jgi:hypothetical protein
MFDERSRGLILRGARAQTETKGRHPYLTAIDAKALVEQSITVYRTHHRHVSARVVVLKTSRFRPEEAEGIGAALKKFGVEMADLLWVQESSPIAVFRDGNYPVLRGTFVGLNGKGLLYTRGSVPTTVRIRACASLGHCCSYLTSTPTARSWRWRRMLWRLQR